MVKRRRRALPPQGTFELEVESLTHDGRGVGRIDGRPVFIHGTLPDERVSFEYTEVRRDFAEGRLVDVLSASPLRVEPRCQHYGVCGGCSFQHVDDVEQIRFKQGLLLDQFQRIGKLEGFPVFDPLTGPCWGYRQKARLGVKFVHKKGKVLVGFRERSSPFITEIDVCPVLDARVGARLSVISEMIHGLSIRDRVPQIEVAMSDDQVALVFRILEDLSNEDRKRFEDFARDEGFDVFLQRGGPDSVVPLLSEVPPFLQYAIPESDVHFSFKATDFTQVNAIINQKMIGRVLELLDPQPTDMILDLFCGIGNFTLPLARRAAHVVGVEGSAEAVERARQNAESNGITNAEFHVSDLSKPVEGQPWAMQKFDKILLDPSRAGALEILERIPHWSPARIVYVSCNPSTLARDAGVLVQEHGYAVLGAGVMDMFPQTAHVESIALLEKVGR
jgi:23S rRNA (uracil1939-C5)-methyltransferase